jgi:hypothetical protein
MRRACDEGLDGTHHGLAGFGYTADFTVARALVRRGRTYKESVIMFEPIRATREVNPRTRDALRRIAERARRLGEPAFQFVNNRLEWNTPSTREVVVSPLLPEKKILCEMADGPSRDPGGRA